MTEATRTYRISPYSAGDLDACKTTLAQRGVDSNDGDGSLLAELTHKQAKELRGILQANVHDTTEDDAEKSAIPHGT